MAPAKTNVKPETPGSLKGLIIIEASVAGFLGFWVYSEYVSNLYFQSYANAYLQYLAMYVPILGLSVGMAGLATTVLIWRSMHKTAVQVRAGVGSKAKESPSSLVESPSSHSPTSTSQTFSAGMPIELEGGPVRVGLMNDRKN